MHERKKVDEAIRKNGACQMSRVSITAASVLFFCCFFSWLVCGGGSFPKLVVERDKPLALSVSESGKRYDLSLPVDFMAEVEGAYDGVSIKDLDGDGVGEVIFHLVGGGVNSCSKVLYYTESQRSLNELFFNKGGLCNFKVRNGYVVSSYKEGAEWVEDVYSIKNGKSEIKVSDRCVGCGEVRRKEYRPDGSFVRLLVSDNADFEKRVSRIVKIVSLRARVFSSPGVGFPTNKYLMRGDKVTLVGFDYTLSEDWVEFRFKEGGHY